MSTDTQDAMEMGTKPVTEHAWLKRLVGNWTSESEMHMPDGTVTTATGTEKVVDFGGLWAFGEGETRMGGDSSMQYKIALGYDVSFKEYRGCWFATMSSHLWKYAGKLSPDGNTLTLDCIGPDMEVDGKTANYRDVIAFQDDNSRTLTSYFQGPDGEYHQMMYVKFKRA